MQVSVGGMPANADLLDRGVAVAAVDAEAADVVLVAERHRLLARDVLPGDIGRAHDHVAKPDQQHRQDCKPQARITPAMASARGRKICAIRPLSSRSGHKRRGRGFVARCGVAPATPFARWGPSNAQRFAGGLTKRNLVDPRPGQGQFPVG